MSKKDQKDAKEFNTDDKQNRTDNPIEGGENGNANGDEQNQTTGAEAGTAGQVVADKDKPAPEGTTEQEKEVGTALAEKHETQGKDDVAAKDSPDGLTYSH